MVRQRSVLFEFLGHPSHSQTTSPSQKIYSLALDIDQKKLSIYMIIITRKRSTKFANFMNPRAGVVQRRGNII